MTFARSGRHRWSSFIALLGCLRWIAVAERRSGSASFVLRGEPFNRAGGVHGLSGLRFGGAARRPLRAGGTAQRCGCDELLHGIAVGRQPGSKDLAIPRSHHDAAAIAGELVGSTSIIMARWKCATAPATSSMRSSYHQWAGVPSHLSTLSPGDDHIGLRLPQREQTSRPSRVLYPPHSRHKVRA